MILAKRIPVATPDVVLLDTVAHSSYVNRLYQQTVRLSLCQSNYYKSIKQQSFSSMLNSKLPQRRIKSDSRVPKFGDPVTTIFSAAHHVVLREPVRYSQAHVVIKTLQGTNAKRIKTA